MQALSSKLSPAYSVMSRGEEMWIDKSEYLQDRL